jgi:diguanylate cyclase (GGDEF)-like protein
MDGSVIYRHPAGEDLALAPSPIVSPGDAPTKSIAPADTIEQLLYRSYCDDVTGLMSRRLVDALINAALHRAKANAELVAVAMMDIDKFRQVNDRLGYAAGDQVLQRVAQRLEARAHATDSVLRIGSDVFCLVLTQLRTVDDARDATMRSSDIFGQPFRVGDHDLHLSGRIGCTVYPQDGLDAETLFRNAELALSEAKQAPASTLCMYNAERSHGLRELREIEADLRSAVSGGRFELHYQPQVDCATGGILGAEALLRWRHDRLGSIPPSVFIPIAERNGLINELGDWVIGRAVADIADWQRAGLAAIPISVNVAGMQIVQRDFFKATMDTLRAGGVRPEQFKLELTETSIIEDLNSAALVLREFRAAGVETAIDDFGTGNASLSLLASLPIAMLKIDKSFVDGLTDDDRARRIVDASLGLAKSLEMQVIAEGVENRAQADWLLGRGCRAMQGYHFSRPIPAPQLAQDWLSRR